MWAVVTECIKVDDGVRHGLEYLNDTIFLLIILAEKGGVTVLGSLRAFCLHGPFVGKSWGLAA